MQAMVSKASVLYQYFIFFDIFVILHPKYVGHHSVSECSMFMTCWELPAFRKPGV
jgi:hypothetical protein